MLFGRGSIIYFLYNEKARSCGGVKYRAIEPIEPPGCEDWHDAKIL